MRWLGRGAGSLGETGPRRSAEFGNAGMRSGLGLDDAREAIRCGPRADRAPRRVLAQRTDKSPRTVPLRPSLFRRIEPLSQSRRACSVSHSRERSSLRGVPFLGRLLHRTVAVGFSPLASFVEAFTQARDCKCLFTFSHSTSSESDWTALSIGGKPLQYGFQEKKPPAPARRRSDQGAMRDRRRARRPMQKQIAAMDWQFSLCICRTARDAFGITREAIAGTGS
jgi:hypothetical protein